MTILELRDEAVEIVGPDYSVCIDAEAWKHTRTGTESLVWSVYLLHENDNKGQRITAASAEELIDKLKATRPKVTV